jgi:hypothetical protein
MRALGQSATVRRTDFPAFLSSGKVGSEKHSRKVWRWPEKGHVDWFYRYRHARQQEPGGHHPN